MQIDVNNLVSITEANQNFSRVAKLVDQNGALIILKNNTPRYVLIEYSQFQSDNYADDATVQEIGDELIKQHAEAFRELAK